MPTVASLLTLARQAEGLRTGYDQSQRFSWLDVAGRRIVPDRETDCSALTMGLYWLAGWGVDISGTVYTGNAETLARAAGFHVIDVAGWTADSLYPAVRPGDALLGPGHIILAGDDGRWLSAEGDERGSSAGGQAGDQTGAEVRWRAPYMRSRGWTRILRPPVTEDAPVAVPLAATPKPGLVVDGELGPRTITAMQRWLGVEQDGKWGPQTTRALQAKVGARVDGVRGPATTRKVQALIGAHVDGIWGPATTRALQSYLNVALHAPV